MSFAMVTGLDHEQPPMAAGRQRATGGEERRRERGGAVQLHVVRFLSRPSRSRKSRAIGRSVIGTTRALVDAHESTTSALRRSLILVTARTWRRIHGVRDSHDRLCPERLRPRPRRRGRRRRFRRRRSAPRSSLRCSSAGTPDTRGACAGGAGADRVGPHGDRVAAGVLGHGAELDHAFVGADVGVNGVCRADCGLPRRPAGGGLYRPGEST